MLGLIKSAISKRWCVFARIKHLSKEEIQGYSRGVFLVTKPPRPNPAPAFQPSTLKRKRRRRETMQLACLTRAHWLYLHSRISLFACLSLLSDYLVNPLAFASDLASRKHAWLAGQKKSSKARRSKVCSALRHFFSLYRNHRGRGRIWVQHAATFRKSGRFSWRKSTKVIFASRDQSQHDRPEHGRDVEREVNWHCNVIFF